MHNGIRAICTVNSRRSILLWNAEASDGITSACCGHVSLLTLRLSSGEARLDPALPSHFTVTNLTIYSPVVTICTASLTLNNSTFCPHSVFTCFCVDLRTNSDYFTVQHNWLVCITETECLLRGTFYILRSAHTVYLCVLCGSENKQRLFRCTALTHWFL